MRAYIFGGAVSSALIAAALAAFLSATTFVARTTVPGNTASVLASTPEPVTVQLPAPSRDEPEAGESSVAPATTAPPIPILSVATLPVPSSSPAADVNGGDGGSSPIRSGRESRAKRPPEGAPADGPSFSKSSEYGRRPDRAKRPSGIPAGLAKKPGWLPPGLAKKPSGLPPGLANKGKVPPGLARKHG